MGGYALEEVKEVNDQAQTLVTERFTLAEQIATQQVEAAQGYLTALATLFPVSMPSTYISYNHQDVTLSSSLDRPTAPTDEVERVDPPYHEPLNNITVPTISIPSYTLESLTNELSFSEPIYSSDLQNALKAVLKDFVENGGTGLGVDVEVALWTRARARQDLLNERTYNEAEEYFASRGYTIPPGALGGRLTEALAEQIRGDAQLNYEISIEQARLARAQSEYSLKAALELEGQDKEKFTAMANRTLEAAKAAAQVITDLYEMKVRAYIARCEAAKINVEAEKIQVEAAVAANESIVGIYNADIEKYKAQVQNEIAIVELVAKVYGFTVAGYEADAKVAAADLEAQIKAYQGRIDQANNQTALSIKEAELTIQSYLGALELTAEAAKASGNISAQVAASALSAVNASASLGAHATSSYGSGSNYSKAESDSLQEIHYYDETAP